MLRVVWRILAVGNFGAAVIDYGCNFWALFFVNVAFAFLFTLLAIESPAKQAEEHEDE